MSAFWMLLGAVPLLLWLWMSRTRHVEEEEEIQDDGYERCPRCNTRFSEWFFWPDRGDYCWPCYRKTGEVIVRPSHENPETRKERR